MIDFETAKNNPENCFATPKDVLSHEEFSNVQKVQILKQWEYDARELDVATEENMSGDQPSMLSRVLDALQELGSSSNQGKSAPTEESG